MGNWPSKFNDEPFIFHTPPLTARHLKKVASGIRKNSVKYFASRIHQKNGYEKLTQSIKSSLRMYMIDFLHNRVRACSLKKEVSKIFFIILKRLNTKHCKIS